MVLLSSSMLWHSYQTLSSKELMVSLQ